MESFSPSWSDDERWRVDPDPRFSVGGRADLGGADVEVLFESIRDVEVMGDGRVAVADEGAAEVLVFDPDGSLQVRFGGRGEGPGELDGIWRLLRCGADTLAVAFRWQVDFFDPQGRFLRRVVTTDGQKPLSVRGVSSDCGRLLLSEGSESPAVNSQGYLRTTLTWSEGSFERRDTVARPIVGEARTVRLYGDPVAMVLPWTPYRDNVGVAPRNRLIVGYGGRAELRAYGPSGGLERIVRWHARPDPVTNEDRERYEEKRAALLAEHGRAPSVQASFPPLTGFDEVPSAKPVFDGIEIDDQGNVWLRQFPPTSLGVADLRPPHPPGIASERWTVLDASGAWLGEVRLPEGFELEAVGNGRVYGVQRDELRVESVVGFRLVR